MTFLTYEFTACLVTAMTIKKVAQKLADVPILLKVVHFAFVGLFCVIGVAGFHIMVWICFRHQEFTEAFSNPNPFGVGTTLFQCIVYAFAPAGAVLFVASVKLGELRNWARRIIMNLALPYSFLYPCIMSTASGKGQMHSDFQYAFTVTVGLLVLSLSAMIFYRYKIIGNYLVFK